MSEPSADLLTELRHLEQVFSAVLFQENILDYIVYVNLDDETPVDSNAFIEALERAPKALGKASRKLEDAEEYIRNLSNSAYCTEGHRLELPAQKGTAMFAKDLKEE